MPITTTSLRSTTMMAPVQGFATVLAVHSTWAFWCCGDAPPITKGLEIHESLKLFINLFVFNQSFGMKNTQNTRQT